ncbi:MAG: peptide chain release factor 2 [Candidatus Uhrbacteria bacterium]|nr:peptide chain release factor 2 [Patescibacteria group bacterium]MBU1906528.1 peptide chain release factor 2 [Patescibacteria group bacterium]
MKDLLKQIDELKRRVVETWALLDLDTVKTELESLEVEMSAAEFWSDQDKAKSVSKQAADLKTELGTWENFISEVDDLRELASSDDESLHDDVAASLAELEARFAKMEFATLFGGEYDKNNAIVTFHAGSGGTDSQDWAEMLVRMITRFAEQKGFTVEILFESRGSEAGIKSLTMRVSGRYAYGYLKSEHGVHRLVRISPFDAEKMRHTSFALIEVIPELEEAAEIKIDPKDIRIDTFMAGGHGGQGVNTTYSAVRIVHEPTKTTVTCQNERSQKQNKESAMKVLQSKLHQLKLQEEAAKKKELRGEYQSAEWGNQIRSYVLHPYKMVKDHRTEYESQDPDAVLAGDLEPFMEAYLRMQLEQSDRFEEANKDKG